MTPTDREALDAALRDVQQRLLVAGDTAMSRTVLTARLELRTLAAELLRRGDGPG